MKGVVFTEFLEMVEASHGYEMVDDLINESDLSSEGAYTSVGTYDHHEIIALFSTLSKKTTTPIPILFRNFGKYIFDVFARKYTFFFNNSDNAFDFLESVESYIHVEVRKLYPDAELPRFETKRVGNTTLEMMYYSNRSMSDFAMGLIEKVLEYYNEDANVERIYLTDNGSQVQFIISK